MSEELYVSLRDTTAANLLLKFGRGAILRKLAAPDYDPATGIATQAPSDTNVRVIEIGLAAMLKGREGKNQFTDEQVKMWDSALLMSAKETAAAGVEPATGDLIVLGGKTCRIAWIEPVSPSGLAIIYKMAIARK